MYTLHGYVAPDLFQRAQMSQYSCSYEVFLFLFIIYAYE